MKDEIKMKKEEWHYLNENPNDLPKNREKVLLLVKLNDKWNRILQIRNENGWEQGTNKEQIGTDEDGSFKWEYNGYKWTLSYLKQYESIWYIAKLTKNKKR